MNIIKSITAFALCLTATNLLCWDGELVEIAKGDKSVAFMIRYYSEHEQDAYTQLHNEGFKFVGNHLGMQTDGEILSICGPAHHFFVQDGAALYEQWKKLINSPQADSFNDLFNLHNQWLMCGHKHPQVDKKFKRSKVIVLANINEKEKYSKMLNSYKSTMKRIALEDSSVLSTEIVIKHPNGFPSYKIYQQMGQSQSFWNRFKNFVCNEKFLYAMSALSALYLGYEYLKQN